MGFPINRQVYTGHGTYDLHALMQQAARLDRIWRSQNLAVAFRNKALIMRHKARERIKRIRLAKAKQQQWRWRRTHQYKKVHYYKPPH